MSKKFLNVSLEIDNPEWKKQENNGKFFGECELKICNPDYRDKEFKKILGRGLMLGYDPNDSEGKYYPRLKGLAECAVNLLQDVTSSMSKSVVDYGGRKTEDNLDVEFMHQVRMIANLLQWMVNSTSWREADYLPFDAMDIEMQLKHIMGMCNFNNKKEEKK